MGRFSTFRWMIVFCIAAVPLLIIALVADMLRRRQDQVKNTWKLRTFFYVGFAVALVSAIYTVPLFLFLAYRSYIAGVAPLPIVPYRNRTDEINRLQASLFNGEITQAEFSVAVKNVLDT